MAKKDKLNCDVVRTCVCGLSDTCKGPTRNKYCRILEFLEKEQKRLNEKDSKEKTDKK